MLAGGSVDGMAAVRGSDGSGGAGADVDGPTAGPLLLFKYVVAFLV